MTRGLGRGPLHVSDVIALDGDQRMAIARMSLDQSSTAIDREISSISHLNCFGCADPWRTTVCDNLQSLPPTWLHHCDHGSNNNQPQKVGMLAELILFSAPKTLSRDP